MSWRWRRARLSSSADFLINLRNARRKRLENMNCRRRFAIGLAGHETEPTQPIRFSARPMNWSPRIPHYMNGVIVIAEGVWREENSIPAFIPANQR